MRKLRLHRKTAPAPAPTKAEAKASNNAVKSAISEVLGTTNAPAPNPPLAISPPLPSLSPRHLAFIDAYCELKNITKAALKAGYAKRSARQQGGDLLRNPAISREINRRLNMVSDNAIELLQVNTNFLLQKLVHIATWDIGDLLDDDGHFVNLKTLTPAQRCAVANVTIEEFIDGRSDKRRIRRMKVSMAPKIPAIELLGKYCKMFEGDQKPLADAVGIIASILQEIDHDSRAARAKTINHVPMPAGGDK